VKALPVVGRALLTLLMLASALVAQAAPERLAWVVGQEAYPNARLRTVTRDARAMAATLSEAGWKVQSAPIDAPPTVLNADVNAFLDRVSKSPGAEVLVYLSGHGVEVDGEARLQVIVPAGNARRPAQAATLSVSALLAGIESAGASLAVVVFDACRDTRAASAYRQLTLSDRKRARAIGTGTMEHLVLYATASGTTAEDGVASGGRFTSELVAALSLAGVTVQDAFERARSQVWARTQGKQRPEMAVSSSAVAFKNAIDKPLEAREPGSEAAADDARLLASVRRLLSTEQATARSAISDEDRQTERDIDLVLQLLLPPVQASQRTLERLVAQGMPWAALMLALSDFGSPEPGRARQIAEQLRRAGLEARLNALHRRGSHAATSALALLAITRDDRDGGQREARTLMRAAARAGYEPAVHFHLAWSTQDVTPDEVTVATEEAIRTRAASGDLPAQWTLAVLTYDRFGNAVRHGSAVDLAAARAGMVGAMQPFLDRVPSAGNLVVRAYFDPMLGPPDLVSADNLCEQARLARNASTLIVCAASWSGRELPRRDPARALALMREAADLGDPSAANQTGLWLKEGFGALPDRVASFRYLDSCATRGSLQCMVNAANALRMGDGTPRDVHRAAELYRAAANHGNNWAGNRLAQMLLDEPELQRDGSEARRWLLHGIEKDDPEAWTTLAGLLRFGRAGVPLSQDGARSVYAKAARMGSASAMAHFCGMLITGEGGGRDVTEGLACLERMAKADDPMATISLANLYMHGGPTLRDEARAYRLYEALAERGEPAGLAQMGQFHRFGMGGQAVDHVRARRLYEQAADKGSVEGLAYLGSLMVARPLSPADRRNGIAKLEDAAATGNALAQWLLADELLSGRAVGHDTERGVALLRAASRGGSVDAQFALARRLIAGDAVTREPAQGRALLEALATQRDDIRAMNELGLVAEFGRSGDAPDAAESARWYRTAAAKGDGFALAKLGRYAMYGIGESIDTAKAVGLYRQASDTGHPWATYLLGDAYANGRGVAIDRELAQSLLLRAAEAGEALAQTDLGYYLMGNAGFTQDVDQGMRWTRAGAQAGNSMAMNNLGYYLHSGRAGASDTREAVRLWMLAAEAGESRAMWQLWDVLSRGDGVPADLSAAELWLRKAAAAGHSDAVALLAQRANITTGLAPGEETSQDSLPHAGAAPRRDRIIDGGCLPPSLASGCN